jgi:macrolide transport system ATP-binding/permease protein
MTAAISAPLLMLERVSRSYGEGDQRTLALKEITLSIQAGEMVALVGPSGSGKSTLLNILGCLDTPSGGRYCIKGEDTRHVNQERLAWLRRKYFGFVFQRYQLIPDQNALNNVALPAIYAGISRQQRLERAHQLLALFGLGHRGTAFPSQLSGGQQQRVSIARALMNGGQIILADEPTGALDRQTGEDVMSTLQMLRTRGHTVLVVTHDASVAACADRVIQLRDGEIISDERKVPMTSTPKESRGQTGNATLRWGRALIEAAGMALSAIKGRPLRAVLTALGIVIGITAVSCMVGLGQGARAKVVSDIKAMGYNTFTLYPGRGWGDKNARHIHTLVSEDAELLSHISGIESISPLVYAFPTMQNGNRQVQAQLTGVNEHYLALAGRHVQEGRSLTADDITGQKPAIVIDKNVRDSLFGALDNPIGKDIQIDRFMATVVGVVDNDNFLRHSASYIPWSVLLVRQTSRTSVDAIAYKVRDGADKALIQKQVEALLSMRHGKKDFFISSPEEITKAVERSTATLTLLILSIALIALLIGGIGIMNMMLFSVTERTHEIGIRLALGASQRDIMLQFIIEALVICLASGLAGVTLSGLISALAPKLLNEIPLVFSPLSVVAAVTCSTLTGLLFGYIPARRAASLNPISALARE